MLKSGSAKQNFFLDSLALSKWRCRWKCLTVSSKMSAFSSLVCLFEGPPLFDPPSPLMPLEPWFFVDSKISAFKMARLWLIRARRRFSINGLFVRFNRGSADEDVVEVLGETEAAGVVNNPPPFGEWFGIPTTSLETFKSAWVREELNLNKNRPER